LFGKHASAVEPTFEFGEIARRSLLPHGAVGSHNRCFEVAERRPSVGEPNAVCLGREAEQPPVGIEGVGPPRLGDLKPDFLASHDETLIHAAVDSEDNVQRVRSEPGDLHDLGKPRGVETAKTGTGLMFSNAVITAFCWTFSRPIRSS
jgi:hypothetical protein